MPLQKIFEKYFSKILAYAEGIITKNALAFFKMQLAAAPTYKV